LIWPKPGFSGQRENRGELGEGGVEIFDNFGGEDLSLTGNSRLAIGIVDRFNDMTFLTIRPLRSEFHPASR
jgi:hypothetical protein